MLSNKKVKAGALQFVLFVGALIAVLLLTFVLLHQAHQLFDKKTLKTVQLVQKADMGVQYAMEQNLPLNNSVLLNLPGDDGINVYVEKSYWGVFEKYSVVTKFKKNKYVKTALVGGAMGQQFPALYLKDNDRPMIIAGRSKITGNAYLPKQGIRPGGIGGHFYQYSTPVFGNTKHSSKELPSIDMSLKISFEELLNPLFGDEGNGQLRYQRNMKVMNSFKSSTQLVTGYVLRLDDIELVGNVIVVASGQIEVGAHSTINDALLVAPKIVIESGFKGSLQAIASREIVVEENVELEYPSALLVNMEKGVVPKKNGIPNILVKKNSTVRGVVSYHGKLAENSFIPQVKIEENALVQGEVYCEENLELKGTVHGKVWTNNFISLENGSVYQNHLFNGTIDSSILPVQFAGLVLDDKKTIAKWMY
ncbi:hypothetical protein [Flagellimonas nanhaiensis]|uniref:Polymer-forming cytoskeletal protein n=1 Tax=Flagellimonas nanhaiensis TaxID=2292706 RepID=A0A371JSK0_9FLAO|nr:hypothetical protein [Allomuricauda nanhaiensis]RDY60784.1 hypothetical protein DX873_00970 [Allomuricauda nanhaiensis]